MMRWLKFGITAAGLAACLLAAADGDNLPAGAGKDVLVRMCANCHGLDQVTAAKYSKKFWSGVVDDMVTRGAEGSDEDIAAVIVYLSRNFGMPVNINSATAKEIEDDLSFEPAAAQAVVRYRGEKGAFQTYEDLLKVPGIDAKLLDEQKKNIRF